MSLEEMSIYTLLDLLGEFAAMDNYDPTDSRRDRLQREYPGITAGMVRQEIIIRVPIEWRAEDRQR